MTLNVTPTRSRWELYREPPEEDEDTESRDLDRADEILTERYEREDRRCQNSERSR